MIYWTQWWFCPFGANPASQCVCYLCTLCICPWKLIQGEGRRKHYPEPFVFSFSFVLGATFWTGIYLPSQRGLFPLQALISFSFAPSPWENNWHSPKYLDTLIARSSTSHFMVSYENHLCPAVLWVNPFLPWGCCPCWQQEAAGPRRDSLVCTRIAPFTGDARLGLLWKLTKAKGKHTDNSKG